MSFYNLNIVIVSSSLLNSYFLSTTHSSRRSPLAYLSHFSATSAAAVLCLVALLAYTGMFGRVGAGFSLSPRSVQRAPRPTLLSAVAGLVVGRFEAAQEPLTPRGLEFSPLALASGSAAAPHGLKQGQKNKKNIGGHVKQASVGFRTASASDAADAAGAADDDNDDDEVPCEFIDHKEDPCLFVRQHCETENLVNFLKLRYCVLANGRSPAATAGFVGIMLLVLLVTLSLLATTADHFFVPALTVMSRLLNLSPSVAGMTFLAFGNGAPDIFSALAALAADDVPLLLGAIIGAGVCIMGLVAGTTIAVSTGKLNKSGFWRDILAYAVSLGTVFWTFHNGRVNAYEAGSLLVLYVAYVAAVVVVIQIKRCRKSRAERDAARARGVSVATHRRELRRGESLRAALLLSDGTDDGPLGASGASDGGPAVGSLGAAAAADEEEDYVEEEDDGIDHATFLAGLSYPHPSWAEAAPAARAFFKLQFAFELPFSLLRWLTLPSMHVRPDLWGPAKRLLGLCAPVPLSLLAMLAFDGDDLATPALGGLPRAAVAALGGAVVAVLMALVYYCWLLPAVARAYDRALTELVARSAVSSSGHGHGLAGAGAAGALPGAAGSLQGSHGHGHNGNGNGLGRGRRHDSELTAATAAASSMGAAAASASVSAAVAEAEAELEDDDWLPRVAVAFKTFCALLTFGGCVAWMVLISNEVVAALQAVGVVLDVSTAILGLTVLAVGNSIPDFVANTALARAGHAQLAFASVFASPLLTTLVGLGAPMLLTCLQQFPTPVTFAVTQQVVITWGAVSAGVLAHMVAFWAWSYKPPRTYGLAMVGFYLAFIAIMVTNELTGPW